MPTQASKDYLDFYLTLANIGTQIKVIQKELGEQALKGSLGSKFRSVLIDIDEKMLQMRQ